MRRPSVPRASTAVAVVAAIVAVLAVIFPGIGFGQPIFSHGGIPTDVYTQTLGSPNDEVCAEVPVDGNDIMQQPFEVAVPSLVVAVASFDWEGLGDREIGVTHLELDGPFWKSPPWRHLVHGPNSHDPGCEHDPEVVVGERSAWTDAYGRRVRGRSSGPRSGPGRRGPLRRRSGLFADGVRQPDGIGDSGKKPIAGCAGG